MKGDFTFPSPYWDPISAAAKDLISHLLERNPANRFTASQALQHKWVKQSETQPPLPAENKEKLKSFQARIRWKRSFNVVKAVGRLTSALKAFTFHHDTSHEIDTHHSDTSRSNNTPTPTQTIPNPNAGSHDNADNNNNFKTVDPKILANKQRVSKLLTNRAEYAAVHTIDNKD